MKFKTTLIASVATLGLGFAATGFASDVPQPGTDSANLQLTVATDQLVQVQMGTPEMFAIYNPSDNLGLATPVCLYTTAASGQVKLKVTNEGGGAPVALTNSSVPTGLGHTLAMNVSYTDYNGVEQPTATDGSDGAVVDASGEPCSGPGGTESSELSINIAAGQTAAALGSYQAQLIATVTPN